MRRKRKPDSVWPVAAAASALLLGVGGIAGWLASQGGASQKLAQKLPSLKNAVQERLGLSTVEEEEEEEEAVSESPEEEEEEPEPEPEELKQEVAEILEEDAELAGYEKPEQYVSRNSEASEPEEFKSAQELLEEQVRELEGIQRLSYDELKRLSLVLRRMLTTKQLTFTEGQKLLSRIQMIESFIGRRMKLGQHKKRSRSRSSSTPSAKENALNEDENNDEKQQEMWLVPPPPPPAHSELVIQAPPWEEAPAAPPHDFGTGTAAEENKRPTWRDALLERKQAVPAEPEKRQLSLAEEILQGRKLRKAAERELGPAPSTAAKGSAQVDIMTALKARLGQIRQDTKPRPASGGSGKDQDEN